MKRHTRLLGAVVGAAISAAVGSPTALAANQEPAGLNLGLTSFFDGFGKNEEGFVYLAYAVYSSSRRINDDHGNALPIFNNPKIDSYVLINQFVYVLPETLFGGEAHPGFMFLLPIVAFNTSFDPAPPPPGVQLKDNGVGIGDLAFGPFIQFRPIMHDGRPIFSHRAEIDVIAPIGAYDATKDINQGANFASLNPYWAFTALPIPGLEISMRLHYLLNFANHAPANLPPDGPSPVVTATAGQAFWVNYTASYEILHGLHVGVNGYYFKQFTDDKYTHADGTSDNGLASGDTGQAQFLTVGPGLFWDINRENKLFANVYLSVLADNRPVSNVFNLHYVHDF